MTKAPFAAGTGHARTQNRGGIGRRMEANRTPSRLLVLFAAVAHAAAVAQTGSTQLGAPAPKASEKLLEGRAAEIKASSPNDKDIQFATDALAGQLKLIPRLQQTTVAPCPPAPPPAPAGMKTSVLVIGKPRSWAEQMPAHVERAQLELMSSSKLTPSQKNALSNYVSPRFKEPGLPGKFETVVLPGCPTPAPPPAGKGAAANKGEQR